MVAGSDERRRGVNQVQQAGRKTRGAEALFRGRVQQAGAATSPIFYAKSILVLSMGLLDVETGLLKTLQIDF